MKPTPLQDLVRFLDSTGRALTNRNVREVAKLLSFTDGELMLALAMVKRQPRVDVVVECGPVPVRYFYRVEREPKEALLSFREVYGWSI